MGLLVKIGFTHFFSFFSAEQVHRAMDRGMRSEGNLHDVAKTSATALYTAVLRTQPWCSHAHRRQVPWCWLQSSPRHQSHGATTVSHHPGSRTAQSAETSLQM